MTALPPPLPVPPAPPPRQAIDKAPDRVSLAIVDHISSVPAIKFPLEDIVRVCAERGVPVLVDAAHSIGQARPFTIPPLPAPFQPTCTRAPLSLGRRGTPRPLQWQSR